MRLLDDYIQDARTLPPTGHIGYMLRTSPDPAYVAAVRGIWDGLLVLKGVMDAAQVEGLADLGVDGLWVSNHAGRQFDGALASVEALPAIRAATKLPLIFDSGVNGGLDILRTLALGANFVMLGRAWHYALGALGAQGPAHFTKMLQKDIESNMGQIGASSFADLPARLVPGGNTICG